MISVCWQRGHLKLCVLGALTQVHGRHSIDVLLQDRMRMVAGVEQYRHSGYFVEGVVSMLAKVHRSDNVQYVGLVNDQYCILNCCSLPNYIY